MARRTSSSRSSAEIAHRPCDGTGAVVVGEVLVGRLEEAEVAPVGGRGRADSGRCRTRSATGCARNSAAAARGWRPSSAMRAEKSIAQVRIGRQQAVDVGEVLGVAAHVRGDERRARMRRDERLERGHQPVEASGTRVPRTTTRDARRAPRAARCGDRPGRRTRPGRRCGSAPAVRARRPRGTGRRAAGRRAAAARRPGRGTPSPRSFQTFRPRAPRAWLSRRLATSALLEPGLARRAVKSTWQNVANRPGWARS